MAPKNLGTERALLEQRRHRKMTACGRPALVSRHRESLRMAKPLIPVDVIYEHALALIDAEGAQALNARRLAADLRCSTRTLYQQVGNREELIRALIGRHFSQLQLREVTADECSNQLFTISHLLVQRARRTLEV